MKSEDSNDTRESAPKKKTATKKKTSTKKTVKRKWNEEGAKCFLPNIIAMKECI